MNEPALSLAELEKQTVFGKRELEDIINGFLRSFRHGLDKDENTMIPSFVCRLPTGMETGTYLALDMGGTNLRVAAVTLLGDGKTDIEQKQYLIPEELKTGDAESLFNWIADGTKNLLDSAGIKAKYADKEMYMGVTFSFPIKQTNIDKGRVMKMGKSFKISGLEGHDVVELLRTAFDRQVTIVNDTVGTLVAHAYKDQNTIVSIIVGTGTNAACIVESTEIKKHVFQPNFPQYMIVNTEISLMGSDFLPRTKYDKILDSQSSTPGFQQLEKMVSGLYLGELVRLAIVDYVKNFNLFCGELPGGMEVPYSFTAVQMSNIESDRSSNPENLLKVLTEDFSLPKDKLSTEDTLKVRELVKRFSHRSAQLSSAVAASLIKFQCGDIKEIEREVRIAVDGSVYHHFNKYSFWMGKTLREIQDVKEDKKVKLVGIKNGGCIGAAITAMMYSH
ncbi:11438_t:CDS:2 [Funneliformis geosporum]|uniref:Phosphotransferase n=1 Tax=Funneliformis geosporum TaxID=1117311 RepID=A0A9W4SEE9_9GLOM|nr:15087_t:CDS:2 [Funneliformis geosporum]CAI2171325.1 11438_t:CDS:2 [Funneliformis geosporum]